MGWKFEVRHMYYRGIKMEDNLMNENKIACVTNLKNWSGSRVTTEQVRKESEV